MWSVILAGLVFMPFWSFVSLVSNFLKLSMVTLSVNIFLSARHIHFSQLHCVASPAPLLPSLPPISVPSLQYPLPELLGYATANVL